MNSNLELGDAANLLLGLRPEWADAAGGVCPFFRPPGQPFNTFAMDVLPDETSEWSEPTLSLHDDVEELLNEIFDYRVLPFPADPGVFRMPVNKLMLLDEDRDRPLDALSERLGVRLSCDAGGGYLLLKMRRVVADFMHEAEQGGIGHLKKIKNYWTRKGLNAMGRLRVAEKIYSGADRDAVVTARQAARYVDYFYDFGTHFVSRVEFGDLILQVFACKPDRNRRLKDVLLRESGGTRATGPLAISMRYMTSPEWVSAAGRIVSASGDATLTQSLRAGKWHDEKFAGGDSILAPFARDSATLSKFRSQYSKAVPIAIEFTPHNSFMEVFRSGAWRRLLKAALLQRFAAGIQIPIRKRPSFPGTEYFSDGPMFAAVASPTTRIIQDSLDASDCQFVNGETIEEFTAYSLNLEVTKTSPIPIPGKRVVMCVYQTLAHTEDGTVPVLVLEDQAIEDYEFVSGEVHGALWVTNRSGTRRETILDGLRFATGNVEGDTGRRRVVLRGGVNTLAADTLAGLASTMESSLGIAESLLLAESACGPDAVKFARGYLEWLATNLADDCESQPLRLRVLYLARVAGRISPRKSPSQDESPELHTSELAKIVDVAADIQHLAASLRLHIRESRSRDLEPELHKAARISEAFREFEESAAVVRQAGDQIDDALATIRSRRADNLESHSVRIKKFGDQAIAAAKRILSHVNEIDGDPVDSESPSLARTILEATSGMLSIEPTAIGPQRLQQGDEPISEFWRLVFKLKRSVAAVTAMELMGDYEDRQSLDRAERLLDGLDGPVELPDQREWDSLPDLVIQLVGSGASRGRSSSLQTDLQALAVATDAWLTSRVTRAQLIVDHTLRLQQRKSAHNRLAAVDVSNASHNLLDQKWRLVGLLLQSWNLQDELFESAGLPKIAPLPGLDVAALARSLIVRQRYLEHDVRGLCRSVRD